MLPGRGQESAARSTPGRLATSNASLALGAKFPKRNRSSILVSLDGATDFDATEQYSASKLLAQLFLWELVDRMAARDVVVNLVDPGFVKGTESHDCFLMSWDIDPFAAVYHTAEGRQAASALWAETLE